MTAGYGGRFDIQEVLGMQMFIRGLAVVAILCGGRDSFGSIVIDNFTQSLTTAGSTQNNISGSTFQTSRMWNQTSGAGINVTDNSPAPVAFTWGSGNPNGKSLTLAYNFSTPINLAQVSSNSITFDYAIAPPVGGGSGNVSNFTITISANGGTSTTGPTSLTVNGGTKTFNSGAFSGNPSSVTSLLFTITPVASSNDPNWRFTFVTGITAVPEPATMTLLGLTGIAGVIAHRRRRKLRLAA